MNLNQQIVHHPVGKNLIMTLTGGARASEIHAVMLSRGRPSRQRTTLIVEVVDHNGEVRSLALNGRQARNMFNVMQKHYLRGDKRQAPITERELQFAADEAYADGLMSGIKIATRLCAQATRVNFETLLAACYHQLDLLANHLQRKI